MNEEPVQRATQSDDELDRRAALRLLIAAGLAVPLLGAVTTAIEAQQAQPIDIDPGWFPEDAGTNELRAELVDRVAERVRSIGGTFYPPRSSSPEANEKAEKDITDLHLMTDGAHAICFGPDSSNNSCVARFDFTSPLLGGNRYMATVWPTRENSVVTVLMVHIGPSGVHPYTNPTDLRFTYTVAVPPGDLASARGTFILPGGQSQEFMLNETNRDPRDLEIARRLYRGILEILASGT